MSGRAIRCHWFKIYECGGPGRHDGAQLPLARRSMRKVADYARKCGKRRRKSQMNPPALLQSRLQVRFIGYDAGSF
jgi:hypothetical protein